MIDLRGFREVGGHSVLTFASEQQDAGSCTGLLESRENVLLRWAQIKELA
jgi:hypothetical protein